MRDIYSRKEIILGKDKFYVQQYPPLEGMKVLGELQGIISPAISGAAVGIKDSGILSDGLSGGLLMLAEKLDGEKLEYLSKLLLNPQYVAVKIEGKGQAVALDEDILAQIFTGRYIDMLFLMFKVAQVNFLDFTQLCSLPTGVVTAVENLKKVFAANLAENLNETVSFTEQSTQE